MQPSLAERYDTFSDSQPGDEMFEQTFRCYPTAGIKSADGWTTDTFFAARYILRMFIDWLNQNLVLGFDVYSDELHGVRAAIWHDLTAE